MAPEGRKISMEVRNTPQTPDSQPSYEQNVVIIALMLEMPTQGDSSLKNEKSSEKASQ